MGPNKDQRETYFVNLLPIFLLNMPINKNLSLYGNYS